MNSFYLEAKAEILKKIVVFLVETMTPKSPFEINWPLDDLYGQCGHWCNSVGLTYSHGWFFIEQLRLYIFLHVSQFLLRLCTLAIWSESAVKRRKKINCKSSNLIQLNLHETDLSFQYLSIIPVFMKICTDLSVNLCKYL